MLSLNKDELSVLNWTLSIYLISTVVGEKEKENKTVNVRTRDNKVHGEHGIDHVISRFTHFKTSRSPDAEETF